MSAIGRGIMFLAAVFIICIAAGVSARLVMVSNAGHGFVPESGQPSPSRAEISLAVENFFQDTLE